MLFLKKNNNNIEFSSGVDSDPCIITDTDVYLKVTKKPTKNKIEPNTIINRGVDVILGLAFLFPGIFLINFIYIFHRIYNRKNGGFIYKGDRIGKNKKIFEIYKIRTLKPKSESRIACNVLNPVGNLEIKFGRFLRKTRLDELPQLFNVIRGDLSLIGPRPVRVEMFDKCRHTIPNYDIRFSVKPGLFGLPQLITPHNSPKRLRALINYIYIKNYTSPSRRISMLVFAIVHVIKNLFKELFYKVNDCCINYKNRKTLDDRRLVRRTKDRKTQFLLADENYDNILDYNFKVININSEALCVTTNKNLGVGTKIHFILKTEKTKLKKIKQAKCRVLHFYKKRTIS
jgi:lipopolysaccharide/colanic/teichoic acid biosynthesis glycosyltransferase